ncbi:MAG: hypothetical protein AAF762_01355 [Pseudomonadota bacterium]
MTKRLLALGAALTLAACGTSQYPDINPSTHNGVGFGSEAQFVAMHERAQKSAEMRRAMASASAAPVEMPAVAATEESAIAAETLTALNVQPVSAPLPDALSDEQSFEAVAARQTIESDADRLTQNRDQFVQVQPVSLPVREGGVGGPNIVAYALATTHPVGMVMHPRSGRTTPERHSRVCESYGTDDQAQQAFLANGGPARDRKGVDPDGDGYACDWNPSSFRIARGG